jgi:hypothetical protein
MENLIGEKIKEKKPKKAQDLNVYEVDDEYVWFFVAKSHGAARYAYCMEMGIMFYEAFDAKISVVPCLKKYIKEEHSGHQVNPFEDEYWTRALYAEGGYFTNGSCESNDCELTIQEMLDKECRHSDGTKCEEWDDEMIWINFPKKK